MTPEQTVSLFQVLLREAAIVMGPVVAAGMVTSITISVLQTLTSIQDQTLSVVPRLLVVATVIFLGLPWFVHRLVVFAVANLTDFKRFI